MSSSPFKLLKGALQSSVSVYIYICWTQKALRELGTVPPREPGLGGPFSHYKNSFFEELCVRFWSRLAFLAFSAFSRLGTFLGFIFLFSNILKTLFFASLSFFFLKIQNCLSKNTIKYGFLKGVFFSETQKSLGHELQISILQLVILELSKPLFFCRNPVLEKRPDFVPFVGGH